MQKSFSSELYEGMLFVGGFQHNSNENQGTASYILKMILERNTTQTVPKIIKKVISMES